MLNPASVTPNRRTACFIDVPSRVQTREPWSLSRSAAQMARTVRTDRGDSAPVSENVMFTGESWILKIRHYEFVQGVLSGIGGDLGPDDLRVPEDWSAAKQSQKLTLSGLSPSVNMADTGLYHWVRRPAAGADWGQKLAADESALPNLPVEEDPIYPVERVMVGTKSYPERAPWLFKWAVGKSWEGHGHFASLYWGGPTDVTPAGQAGGQFGLALSGSGQAKLYELGADRGWKKRFEFPFSEPFAKTTSFGFIGVIPYGRDRTLFMTYSSLAISGGTMIGAMATIAATAIQGSKFFAKQREGGFPVFKDLERATGHRHKTAPTGPGTVRLDWRQDLRAPVSIIKTRFPSFDTEALIGIVVDGVFRIHPGTPAGTPIKLTVNAFVPDGCTVVGVIYDAATDNELFTDANGDFLTSNSGQLHYYVKVGLGSSDGSQTPVLWGINLKIEGEFEDQSHAPVEADLHRVFVQGAGLDPTTERANLYLRDLTDAHSILRVRDQLRCRVTVLDSEGAVISHLADGVTVAPQAMLMGKEGQGYPSAEWRDYPNVTLLGLWAKLVRKKNIYPDDKYGQDRTAEPMEGGGFPPWKVTTIIGDLLSRAGVPDAEIDIGPGKTIDLPLRLWPEPGGQLGAEAVVVATGVAFADFAMQLAADYLRMPLVRDPNAGANGMWRLLANPGPPYSNPLFTLQLTEPTGMAGKASWMVGSYPADTIYVHNRGYRSWTVGPEGNVVIVFGMDKHTGALLSAHLVNQASQTGPREHPDRLDGIFPIIPPKTLVLQSQEAVDWTAHTIYDESCHGRHRFVAWCPLIFVSDPTYANQTHRRKPQVNDQCVVRGTDGDVVAVVSSCSVGPYDWDGNQAMLISGWFPTDAAEDTV